MASCVPSRIVAHVDSVQVGGGVVAIITAPAALFRGYSVGIDARILPSVVMKKANQCVHGTFLPLVVTPVTPLFTACHSPHQSPQSTRGHTGEENASGSFLHIGA